MRVRFVALFAAIALLVGCSKKSAPQPEAAAAAPPPAAAAVSKEDNAMVAAALDELNKKIQQQQYDAAVGSLVALSQMPKTDAQAAQFKVRMRETETALYLRANQGDAAAEQSARMLGRMMTGR